MGCPIVAEDLLLGCRVAVRADWDRGVPEAVGEVAVSLRVAVQLGRLAGLEEMLLAVDQMCLPGSSEAGQGELLLAVGGCWL